MIMDVNEADYYRRREKDQRQFADQASSRSIRKLHLDMAERYRKMAQDAQLRHTGQDRGSPTADDAMAST